jgi:PadR family transcriptional regulator, regulatory protein PadR
MISKELMAASTRPLILTILKNGPSYGYKIIQDAKVYSGGTLEWSDGMLYPVLHKLENEGLVQSKWEMADGSRPRKYYHITPAGQEALSEVQGQWLSVHEVLLKLWGPTPKWI